MAMARAKPTGRRTGRRRARRVRVPRVSPVHRRMMRREDCTLFPHEIHDGIAAVRDEGFGDLDGVDVVVYAPGSENRTAESAWFRDGFTPRRETTDIAIFWQLPDTDTGARVYRDYELEGTWILVWVEVEDAPYDRDRQEEFRTLGLDGEPPRKKRFVRGWIVDPSMPTNLSPQGVAIPDPARRSERADRIQFELQGLLTGWCHKGLFLGPTSYAEVEWPHVPVPPSIHRTRKWKKWDFGGARNFWSHWLGSHESGIGCLAVFSIVTRWTSSDEGEEPAAPDSAGDFHHDIVYWYTIFRELYEERHGNAPARQDLST